MGDSGKLIFGNNVRRVRDSVEMTQENLAEAAGLDRSYIGGVERGERNPTLSAILRLASALKVMPASLFEGMGNLTPVSDTPMGMTAATTDEGLLIRFQYDQYDAEYLLPGASQSEFNKVLSVLKDGLVATRGRSDAVASAFLSAVQTWPDANPSDLWTFLISRAYCNRSNHPEANARLNLEQSWKRTSGWALERVLVSHYGQFLRQNEIFVKISSKAEKSALLRSIDDPRIIPDKADILLSYKYDDGEHLLGVVHVKASIAERRTDDVPMSQALIGAGYISVLCTMDSKALPSERPVNLGEFGDPNDAQISDKRRDFEEHGNFSACFSYNRNTLPTEVDKAAAQICVCDFTNPNDRFSQFVIDALRQRSTH